MKDYKDKLVKAGTVLVTKDGKPKLGIRTYRVTEEDEKAGATIGEMWKIATDYNPCNHDLDNAKMGYVKNKIKKYGTNSSVLS